MPGPLLREGLCLLLSGLGVEPVELQPELRALRALLREELPRPHVLQPMSLQDIGRISAIVGYGKTNSIRHLTTVFDTLAPVFRSQTLNGPFIVVSTPIFAIK